MIHNTYWSLPDLLPTIPDQMCRPWKHPGRSKQKDWIRQPELGCKTQMLASVCHHIWFTNLYIYPTSTGKLPPVWKSTKMSNTLVIFLYSLWVNRIAWAPYFMSFILCSTRSPIQIITGTHRAWCRSWHIYPTWAPVHECVHLRLVHTIYIGIKREAPSGPLYIDQVMNTRCHSMQLYQNQSQSPTKSLKFLCH